MIALIAAVSKNKVIGNKGRIPWDIPGEMSRFKELTTGNVVIMGRKTYEEIGRPLPNRYTIVVSSKKSFETDNCTTVKSLKKAIAIAKKKFGSAKNIYISGGAALYKEAIEFVDRMFITEIDIECEGEVYFPEFDRERFDKFIDEHVEGMIPYTYVTYVKRSGNGDSYEE